jgi:hypothetical protein
LEPTESLFEEPDKVDEPQKWHQEAAQHKVFTAKSFLFFLSQL